MAIHHELDLTGRNSAQGQSAEAEFLALASSHGYAVRNATPHEDRTKHFDFVLLKDGKALKVEVKSKKSFCIWHKEQRTKNFFLVEFTGVAGYAGWLYGEADLVAFQEENGFYLVPRKTLVEIAEAKCDRKKWVDHRENMLYKNYGRRDRLDEVSAILVNDVIATRNFTFWKK